MSLGSDKLGKSKAVIGKGLADGTEFKSDPYAIIDDLFLDEEEELVVTVSNKYFGVALKDFLEEMNFTFLESDFNRICHIHKANGTFKFIEHLEDRVEYDLPYDWDPMEEDVRNYISENPIVKKKVADKNPENWDKPNGEDDQKDLIDKSMDSIKSHIKGLQEKFGIGMDEVKRMVKDYQKKTHHSFNETVYTAKGNPDIKLKSGVYDNIVDLVRKHEWENQFESDFGEDIITYMRDNGETEGIEEKLLTDFGFEYCLENIDIEDSEFWTNRIIEVKYQDQEELPEMDLSEFEENQERLSQKSENKEEESDNGISEEADPSEKYRLMCDNGEIIERTFQIDGYQVAERLLEDVMFEITFTEDGQITEVKVEEESKDYFSQFNEEKYLKEVREYAQDIINEGDEVMISESVVDKYGTDVAWVEPPESKAEENKKNQPIPIKVGKFKF